MIVAFSCDLLHLLPCVVNKAIEYKMCFYSAFAHCDVWLTFTHVNIHACAIVIPMGIKTLGPFL